MEGSQRIEHAPPTLVFLQKSRSLQHDSSTTTSGPRLGSMVTAPMEEVSTIRLTVPASAAAFITYSVPLTAGSTICSCEECIDQRLVHVCKCVAMKNGEASGATYWVVGNGGCGVEDAVAAVDGAADGIVVEEVGLAESQPLGGAVERLQVRVLRVICRRSTILNTLLP